MKKQKSLETILVLVTALIVFYLFNQNKYMLYASVALASIGLFIPSIAAKIHWAWMKLAEGFGYIMNRLLLSIIFFVFLVPLSLLKNILGYKSQIKNKQLKDSYFTNRNFTYDKKSLENVW